jgi:TonB-linked SusC/RagA family outer membrane protein
MITIRISRRVFCFVVLCFSLCATHLVAQQENEETGYPTDSLFVDLDEIIDMGFIKTKRSDIVGAVANIKPQDDIKFDHTQSVRDALSNKTPGLQWSDNIRGLGTALIIVDGIPGRSIDLLNMAEIESITVLKDANALALYGAMAKNGVIVVTTKRGQPGKPGVNISLNSGLKSPIRLPQYLSSAEYMTFYNQAYKNDGLGEFRYDPETEIPFYRDGVNPYKYPDVDFFSDDYLKPFASYSNLLTEFYGGNEGTQYYINLGFNQDGSILKFDEAKGNIRFNIRGNVDFKVNDWIKSSIDAVAIFNQNRNTHGNFWDASNRFRPNLYSPLLPLSLFETADNPELEGILSAANKFNGNVLGGLKVYEGNTPFGDFYAKGFNSNFTRISQVNNSIDFDLNSLIDGLSAKTYLSFDFYNSYRTSISNRYSVYGPTWEGDKIVALERLKDPDRKDVSEALSNNGFLMRYGFYGLVNYEKNFGENHAFKSSLIGYANNTIDDEEKQTFKNAHVGLNLLYVFKNRLSFDFSGAYINSIKLAEGNRGAFSPTFGLGYVVSEHIDASWLNHLKLRSSIGFIRHDIDMKDNGVSYYLYSSVFRKDWNSFKWGENSDNETTRFDRGENLDLKAELRKDINIGFEAIMYNSLWIEANVFQTDMADKLTRMNVPYPSYYSEFRPYGNYNEDRFSGFELGMNYFKKINDFSFNVGGRVLYATSERTVVDEVYVNDFQYRAGKPVDARWGHTFIGYYGVDDFDADGNLLDGIPVPQYGQVKPGDLMYLDKDGNGKIDDQDMHQIGRWRSPWNYGADMKLTYKRLTLYTVLSGESGSEAEKSGSYYRPQGDNKYSEVVRGAWTEETAGTATFPRLSTQNSTNNFGKSSTFWLYDQGFLSISRMQLTYDFPQNLVQDFSIFVAGSNIATFAKHRKERETRPGSSPSYRYFTLGFRVIL